jgi:hypothetical protein
LRAIDFWKLVTTKYGGQRNAQFERNRIIFLFHVSPSRVAGFAATGIEQDCAVRVDRSFDGSRLGFFVLRDLLFDTSFVDPF